MQMQRFSRRGASNRQSTLETGTLLLTASGSVDPNGQNDLAANLIGTAGPVDFRWPLENGEVQALINGLDLSLKGKR